MTLGYRVLDVPASEHLEALGSSEATP